MEKVNRKRNIQRGVLVATSVLLLLGLASCNKEQQEKKDYLAYVKGLRNWKIQEGTKNPDFMEGISWDKKEIKKVTVNDKNVDLSKTGSYDIVYTIDIKNEDEKDIKKKYTVSVVEKTNKEDSKKEPSKTDDKKTDESKKEESAKPVENKPSSDKDSKPSTTDKKPSANNTSKPEVSKPSKPSNNKPSHKHEWVEQFTTIHHDAIYEDKWIVDRPAYSEQVPITEMREYSVCNGCGKDITGDPWGHLENSLDCWGYHSEWKEVVVGYETVNHPEEGHYEKVCVKDAWDEKKSNGYKCSCGAKK